MTERCYRLFQGLYLFFALYYENELMMYFFIGLLAFEAITNLRVPLIYAKVRYGKYDEGKTIVFNGVHQLDSERLLRIVVVAFLLVSYVLFPEVVWFFPWFVAAMLFLAGITNICPMVMMFQSLGFR